VVFGCTAVKRRQDQIQLQTDLGAVWLSQLEMADCSTLYQAEHLRYTSRTSLTVKMDAAATVKI
jgi:hypothetical protein